VLAVPLAILGWRVSNAGDAEARIIDQMVADLAPHVHAGDAVQTFDTARGALAAMLRLHLRPASRFLYDFPLLQPDGDPRPPAFRRELLGDLRARPPAAIVVTRSSWPSGGYDRLDRFPELLALLARDYRLAIDRDAYRIYLPRPRAETGE